MCVCVCVCVCVCMCVYTYYIGEQVEVRVDEIGACVFQPSFFRVIRIVKVCHTLDAVQCATRINHACARLCCMLTYADVC